jgi:hypothetical protein
MADNCPAFVMKLNDKERNSEDMEVISANQPEYSNILLNNRGLMAAMDDNGSHSYLIG